MIFSSFKCFPLFAIRLYFMNGTSSSPSLSVVFPIHNKVYIDCLMTVRLNRSDINRYLSAPSNGRHYREKNFPFSICAE